MLVQPIDYTSLNKKARPLYRWLALLVISILLGAGIVLYIVHYNLFDSESLEANITIYAFLINLVLFVVFACMLLYTYNRSHDRRLEAFAKDNGWHRNKKKLTETVPGTLNDLFRDTFVRFEVEGKYRGLPIQLGLFESSAERMNITFYILCLKIDLSSANPYMILLSNSDKFDLANIVADKPDNARVLQLEGNFKESFKLFVKKNAEREVLEVLTPDVMERLANIERPSSITLNGRELCLFVQANQFTETELTRIFATADVALNDL